MSWDVKNTENIKQFKEQLQYLHRIMKSSLTKPKQSSIHPRIVAPGQISSDDTAQQLSFTGPCATINSIIKSFLMNPPSLNLHVSPTWMNTHNPVKIPTINSSLQDQTLASHKRIIPPNNTISSKIRASPDLYRPPASRDPKVVEVFPPENIQTHNKLGGKRWKPLQR
ncbi:hypothetical protein HZS_4787 [Henneguya salminicola]|nr:hypothetical protein HZS_4787 [Henneguya salminicola]